MVKVTQQVRVGPASGSRASQANALSCAAGSLAHSVLHQIQACSGKKFAVLTAAKFAWHRFRLCDAFFQLLSRKIEVPQWKLGTFLEQLTMVVNQLST